MSENYDYIAQKIRSLFPDRSGASPVCLDFGCGAGEIVALGTQAGLDFYGTDRYPEDRTPYYEALLKDRPEIKSRIKRTDEHGTIPFPDAFFDVVVSNMVFEHIADLEKPLREIQRVLKPGGLFLALFPTSETWWEGHAKLWFAHKFKPGSKLQITYLRLMKKLGLGKDGRQPDPEKWAQEFGKYFQEYCFYHTTAQVHKWWYDAFAARPEGWEADYMLFRLGRHRKLSKLAPVLKLPPFRPLLAWACRLRASRVLAIRKPSMTVREARRAA